MAPSPNRTTSSAPPRCRARRLPVDRSGLRGLVPLTPRSLEYDKSPCTSLDGLTPRRALDLSGREALLRYVLRLPIAEGRSNAAPMAWCASRSSERTPTAPDGRYDGKSRLRRRALAFTLAEP